MRSLILLSCGAALAALPRAQSLRMDTAIAIQPTGATASYDVFGAVGAPFGLFVDLDGGPVDVLGVRFLLGLTPVLTPLRTGLLSTGGTLGSASGSYSLPPLPGLSGLVIYGQAVVLDAAAPNGVFRLSNGASTAFFAASGAIAADFTNPLGTGFTGSFTADVAGHVRGGPVTVRTHRTIDPQGAAFGQPVQSPLVPFGCRQQMVFRTVDVGATGEPELLTGVRWMPHPIAAPQFDVHSQFDLRAGHTHVTPDYTVDPFSALPVAPNSGLALTFANNTIAGAPPQVLYSGAYVVDPAQLLPSGYLPYPVLTPFRYDGVSSLLLEFRVGPSTANGVNGGLVRLMVQSTAQPNGRVLARGTPTSFLIPNQTPDATTGDNAMHDLELEFTRVETHCESPWFDTGRPAPDFGAPIVGLSLPAGTSVHTLYRGADNAAGSSPTAWSPSPDVADGKRWLQFRIVFVASQLTGERPLVDTLVVPFH